MDNLRILKIISNGELEENPKDTDSLLQDAGRALDKNNAHDIIGSVVFLGEDGNVYVASTEVVIDKANPDYINEMINDIVDQGDIDLETFAAMEKYVQTSPVKESD